MTDGRSLARNTALNVAGQVLPMAIAVLSIPPLVRGLGVERFAVLALAWAAIGYFSVFELGLSRALTQVVAQKLGSGATDELPAVTWSAILLLLVFGAVGGLLLGLATPTLVRHVLNVPGWMVGETITAFWILSASLPLVVTTVGLRGLMEAHQHFGIATLLRIPLATLNFLGPLMLLPFSHSLVPVVSVLVVGRIIGFVAHLVVCWNVYPYFRHPALVHREAALPLLRFGGWTTVSNVVSPMMVVMDRFVIGAILPLAAVAHYVTPYEAVVKLLIVPSSLIGVMLPAFAATAASNPARLLQLHEKSLRATMIVTFPLVIVAVVLAREGLLLWIGPTLPEVSARVLQWLAVGVLATAVAQSPLTVLQGVGRPDLIARLHVLELPFYSVALFVLTRAYGLEGTAIAWTLRTAVDAAALAWLAHRKVNVAVWPSRGGAWPLLLMVLAIAAGAQLDSVQWRVVYIVLGLTAFAPLAWYGLLNENEREGIRDWINRPMAHVAPADETGPAEL